MSQKKNTNTDKMHIYVGAFNEPGTTYIKAIARSIETSSNTCTTIKVDSLNKYDLIILEVTAYTLDHGLLAAQASHAKKPTLLVSRNPFTGRSISGINNQYFTLVRYKNVAELKTAVTNFITKNTVDSEDLRFNFFIDRQIYNYLRSKSYDTGKSKSEIIRELLEQEIRRKTP